MNTGRQTIDWAALRNELDGIECNDDPVFLRARSRDYYWYSPILAEQLKGLQADLVVIPQDQDEVLRAAAAIARHRVPLTLRGGGTGNYGQCVPLEGGVVMDLTRLDRVIEIAPGQVRVEAGARIERVDDAARETGQELLMYPSTRRVATIGGFVAGGSGGVGSLRHGMLFDPGNVTYARVVTVEPRPRVVELHGPNIQKVHHAYGTNGIVVELVVALTPATDWTHCAALFDGYATALRFAMAAQAEGLDCYLLTAVERRFAPFYRRFGDRFPPDRDAVFAMVAPPEMPRFRAMAAAQGGRVSFAMTAPELARDRLPPAWECAWNHTTLQALRVDRSWTYLQVAYPKPFDPDLVMRQMERYADEVVLASRDGAHGWRGADLRPPSGALPRARGDVPDDRRAGSTRRLHDLRPPCADHRGWRHEGDRRRADRIQEAGRPLRPDEPRQDAGMDRRHGKDRRMTDREEETRR